MKPSGARFGEREQAWCLAANRWGARKAVRIYFRAISRLGDGVFWYALMLSLVLFDGWAGLDATVRMAAVGGLGTLLYQRLKRWARRLRPFAQDQRIRPWVAPLDEFSFPSGHTLHATAFTVVAIAYYPWLAWLLLPFSLSVAASRVVLGVHYPSDVVAGAVIGLLLGVLAIV